MILKKEITEKAGFWGVPPDTVDKDWILGHFLAAFFQVGKHNEKLVFKGGTCLHKCRFPEYRFSEDLDFTSKDPEYRLSRKILNEVLDIATTTSGVQFNLEELKDLIHNDKLAGFQAKIQYWGANHGKNQVPPAPQRWLTRFKIEVTLYEKMIFNPEVCSIYHPFSDTETLAQLKIPCYDLKEVVAEKIRSLVQRSYSAPRDIYDIWKLKDSFNINDWGQIKEAFLEKMKYKHHVYTGVDQLLSKKSIQKLQQAWKRSLSHQIKPSELPDFDSVILELTSLFEKYLD